MVVVFLSGNTKVIQLLRKNNKKYWAVDYPLKWESFDEWLNSIAEKGLAVNYVPLIGYNIVRVAVMKDDYKREASIEESEEIISLIEDALESGAFGIFLSLDPFINFEISKVKKFKS